MRLSKLKIAGFKSFVDPTTIDMRSNLTGIVGPNGCGKSNTIDAVRWVMGESSAKHLRGASMDDVIFNGSSARKPIGQASIEMLFDNTDGSLGGEYAKFDEIGIKRQISRDGQSKYFLNGTRCRRRDITDIFLGTGLGPRSYAIIEQGMISRLIEAKPEELRNTIEEAAGISKYKERRRETETRIRHTRENLERLNDLREELEKQIAHLDRQAKAAERFKKHKATERLLSAELLLLRLQTVQQDIQSRQDIINQNATKHQAQLAEQRSLENQIETQRNKHSEANNALNKVQAEFYQLGSEISRIEQTIAHQKELEARYQRELAQADEELASAKRHAEEDQQRLDEAKQQLSRLEPEYLQQNEQLNASGKALEEAEQQLNQWQKRWNEHQQKLAEPTQQAQVERARMDQLENQIQHIASRLSKLKADQGVFSTHSHEAELKQQQQTQQALQAKHQEAQQAFEQSKLSYQQQFEQNQSLQKELEIKRSQFQSLTGRLASLEALQQAGLGKGSGGKLKQQFSSWLSKHQLDTQPRLAESIVVESGWEKALETVLGDQLEAIQLDSSAKMRLQQALDDAPAIGASFIYNDNNDNNDNKIKPVNNALASKISQPSALLPLLSSIICANSLDDALSLQNNLKMGEQIVTKDGTLLGINWLKKQGKDSQNQRDGVLARQKEIDDIQSTLKSLKHDINQQEQTSERRREQLKQLDEKKSALQNQLNSLHREESQAQSAIHATKNRISQTEANQQRIITEIAELELRHSSEQLAHQKATKLRNQAMALMETLEKDKTTLQNEQAPLQQRVVEKREQTQRQRAQTQQTQLKVETYKANKQSAEQQLERLSERLSQLRNRKKELVEQKSGEQVQNEEDLQLQLEELLEKRKSIDNELSRARDELHTIDNHVRQLELKRHEAETNVDKLRTLLESLKLEWQEVSVREQTLQEQLDETEYDTESLKQSLDENATLKTHQLALEDVQRKIERLGAINLAAIEEFKTQCERKVYLDQQNDDLVEALETLESAIAKIDRDTRNLFKDTFEKVNLRIKEMFPQLFGGGKAYLEMTGDDLLTTGISIMAQPPGKRISSIHLMSGGEKALTAVALVFAIFELNPAPFCMLDEVDAPLDEANVGRFCQLVRKMSERVQFIFITHSKTTMELADNLIGVTMREPGVSRLVSVDVNEAERMANE